MEIRPLSENLLLKMMLDLMGEGNNSPSVDTLLHIIEAVQGHTLTCYLIGNALSDPLGDLTAQDILDALNQYNLHSLTEDVTSDKDRRYTTETIYGHLKLLFNMCGMTSAYRSALCHTLLLPQKGLDIKLFRQGESKDERNALKSLIAHGWVQCACSKENIHLLTIHPLIRELILNEMRPKEEDILPYTNRLWEQYDPWDFTQEEMHQRITLLENALEFFQPGLEWAELHYRLGILWLTNDCHLLPCKEVLILDTRNSLHSYSFDSFFNGYDHLLKSVILTQSNTFPLKESPRYEYYLIGAIFISLIFDFLNQADIWKSVLSFLRLLNKSNNQTYDEKNVCGYLNIVFCLKEIQALIVQESNHSIHRKILCNNLACVCKIAFEELQKFPITTSKDSPLHSGDAESSNPTVLEENFSFYTSGYTESEIFEIKEASKDAASLVEELLKMAEGGSIELQLAVLENRGDWYSAKKNDSTARKYYQEAFNLAERYTKKTDIPFLSYLHSRIGESWRNQYEQTGEIKHLENAITAYHSTYQQWPEYIYSEFIVDCMIQHARAIYTQDPTGGQIEFEKTLDFWNPIVQNVKSSSGIAIYVGSCQKAADIYRTIPIVTEDTLQRNRLFITHQKRAISFLEEGLKRLDSFPIEDFARKFYGVSFYDNIRIMLAGLFSLTQDKHDEEKKFYYWKKYVDAAETVYGSAAKLDTIALAAALEKAGYLKDAAFYRKKAEKFNQES